MTTHQPAALPELQDFGPWHVSHDGKYIDSDNFNHDVKLVVQGDFRNDEQRRSYSLDIAKRLSRPALAALQSQPAAPGVTGAVQTLIETLKADPEYAWAWHCNVAMAAVDEGLSHYAANKAAARFLSWLAQIDTTTHPGFPKAPEQPAAAGVSDAEIDSAWVLNGGGLNSNNYRAFARAILALRPQASATAAEQEGPRAYLICGGRLYKDQAVMGLSVAEDRVATRGDGSRIEPLYTRALRPQAVPMTLPPVEGDVLPAIGSKVLIHLASSDSWAEHEVVGYYVWEAINELAKPRHHRVFVRVRDTDGILNARHICDLRGITTQGAQGGEKLGRVDCGECPNVTSGCESGHCMKAKHGAQGVQ